MPRVKIDTTKLTAKNMKEVLWTTLLKLKNGKMDVAEADAMSSQAREIIKVIKTQQSILSQAGRTVTNDLIEYATK